MFNIEFVNVGHSIGYSLNFRVERYLVNSRAGLLSG